MAYVIKVSLFLLFSCLCGVKLFACESARSDAFPALKGDGGTIVFNYEPPVDQNNESTDDIAIVVELVSCAGDRQLVAGLPFLADTGAVKAAFFESVKADEKPRIFIIHGVEIRSDTGVNYRGDYYTVNVFNHTATGYVSDDRLSTYFGAGGDIAVSANDSVLDYVFPYKNADDIYRKMNSVAYRRWAEGDIVNLTITKKTPIYSSANLHDITKMYLVKSDSVLQESVEAGWIKIIFKTLKNKEIRGWIKCEDADGC